MMELISYFGFSRMPFGRDLAPGMLHRHAAHNEAVARIGWFIAERRIGVITGEVGVARPSPCVPRWPPLTAAPQHHLPADPTVGTRHPPPHRRLPRRPTPDPPRHPGSTGRRRAGCRTPSAGVQPRRRRGGAPFKSRPIGGHPLPPTMISIRRARSPACSSASPPCGGGRYSACWPRWTNASGCATRWRP